MFPSDYGVSSWRWGAGREFQAQAMLLLHTRAGECLAHSMCSINACRWLRVSTSWEPQTWRIWTWPKASSIPEGEGICASHLSEGHAIYPWGSSGEHSSLLLSYSVIKFYWFNSQKSLRFAHFPARSASSPSEVLGLGNGVQNPLCYAPGSFLAELIWAPQSVPDPPSPLVPSARNILLPLVSPLRASFANKLLFAFPLCSFFLSRTPGWFSLTPTSKQPYTFFCTPTNKPL